MCVPEEKWLRGGCESDETAGRQLRLKSLVASGRCSL